MSDSPTLEHLRAIRADVAETEANNYASLAMRIDRIDARLERLARRVELA